MVISKCHFNKKDVYKYYHLFLINNKLKYITNKLEFTEENYIFPKVDTKKFNIVDDEKFALDLLRDKKILIIHGGGFNWHQPDHFRVVYLPRIEVLKEAAGKIRDFLEYYQQEI